MNKRIAPFALVLGALILQYIPQLLAPLSQLDGAWYFSQAVSISNGSFVINNFTNVSMPLLYGWLQADIALIAPNQYGIMAFYAIVLLLFGLFIFKEKKVTIASTCFVLLLLFDHTFQLHRPEPVILILGVITYIVLEKRKAPLVHYILAGLIFTAIHPVNGLLLSGSILVSKNQVNFKNPKIWLIPLIGGAVALAFIKLFPDHIYTTTLLNRLGNWNFNSLLKFSRFSGFTLLGLCLLAPTFWNTQSLLAMFALIIACSLLGGYYYFLFLTVPLILFALKNPLEQKFRFLLYVVVGISFLVNILHPIFTRFENPRYSQQVHAINHELKNLETSEQLFVQNQFAPAVYKNPNCKMLLIDKNQIMVVDEIETGDLLVVTSIKQVLRMRSFLKNEYPDLTYEIEEVLPETAGNLSLTSFYQKRTEGLGLWVLHFYE